MKHQPSYSLHHRLAMLASSALAVMSAQADILWSEINPRPAVIDRAVVRVDPSATTDNKANLGTLGGRFTSTGTGPTHEVNADAKFNALPSLRFDGTAGKLMKLTNFENNSRSLRVFMVHKDVTRSEYKTYLTMNNGGDSSSVMFSVGGAAANNNGEIMRLNMGATYNVAYGNTALSSPAILDYKITPVSDSQIKAVGALHYAASTAHSPGSTNTINCSSSFDHNTLWMGERGRGENAQFGDFYLGELLIFTGTDADAISDDDADAIVSYLRAKWLGAAKTVAVEGVVRVPSGETGHVEHATLTCAASTVFDVADGATLFIDCPIVDGAAPSTFVKRGAGTLVLTRACLMSGQIVVEAGKLELRGEGSLPNAKVNGTLTLGAGAAATFSAQSAPLPAALKKAVVWVDPSVSNARIPANLGTADGSFSAPNGTQTGPAYATGKFSGASGSLPALSFWGGETARILKFTGLQNTSRSLRVFMVHQDNTARTASSWLGYMGLKNGVSGSDFWMCYDDSGVNNFARLMGGNKAVATGNTINHPAIMEYAIKPNSDSQIKGVGALHFKSETVRGVEGMADLSSAFNHGTLWLGDRGGDSKCGRFNLGEFLLFFGDGLNGEALSDDEANEVVAYLRKKWLGATTFVENDRNPAPTTLAVEAGDTATLNGSAVPGLVKTGAGTLKVSGAVSALTVNACAVEFAGDAPTVDALTLADGAGIIYNGVAGAVGTLTVPADTTIHLTLGEAMDRHVKEQTVLTVAEGSIGCAFELDAEDAKRWSVKTVNGRTVTLVKNDGTVIIVR